MTETSVHFDMHGVREPFARMVACRNFEQLVIPIEVAAQDQQDRIILLDTKNVSGFFGCLDGLNVLRNAIDRTIGMLLDLAEQGGAAVFKLGHRIGQIGMNPGKRQRNRPGPAFCGAYAAKDKPLAARMHIRLFSDVRVNLFALKLLERNRGAHGVLKNFTNVGERLMQGAAARRRRLHHRTRSAAALDQAFLGQLAQCLANRKPADPILLAEHGLRGKRLLRTEITAQNCSTQFVGKFKVTGLLDLHFVHLGILSLASSAHIHTRCAFNLSLPVRSA